MKRWMNRFNFSSKLLFVLLTMILIPAVLLSFLEFYYSSRILEEKTNDYLKNLSSVTLSKIESTVSDLENVAFYINGNDSIQNALKSEQNVLEDRPANYKLYKDVREVLTSYVLLRQEIDAISIRSENGRIYTYTKYWTGKPIDITQYLREGRQYWTVDNEHILLIKSLNAFPNQELLGYVALDINEKSLYNIIADIELSWAGKVFLVNEEGRILATEDEALLGEELEPGYMECFGEKEAFYGDAAIDNIRYSVYNSPAIFNGWHMVLAIPRDYYIKDIVELRNIVILITMIVACLAVFASVVISRSITRPIADLSKAMEEFGQGNFDINCEVDSEDEIGHLSRTFNQMVSDMDSLVNTVYEQKVMNQEAQMKSLQMQINPHFLYNTLDTINWMARMKQADEVGDMAAALGNMMRYSLAKKSFATLEEEIKNLKDYLFIQNFRYGDKMRAEIKIADDLMHYYIPKLLIQPILENAIVHGIEDKLDKGYITIAAWQQNNDLYIQVEDDGVGMTEVAIAQILNEDYAPKKKGHTSIGIVNVNRRIQMIYGPDYGLLIQSVLGAGTKMTIHVKAMETEPVC